MDWSDYPGWTWSTSDYQFGSPNGPAYYQTYFPLGINVDYAELPRIIRIYLEYPALLRLLRFTWITLDYPGLPLRITKWSSGLPELSPLPWDYCELRHITPRYSDYSDLLELLQITPIYSNLLRITPGYHFGSPNGPADYQSRSALEITADYARLPRITSDYSYLLWLSRITPIHPRLLRFTLGSPIWT